MKRSVLISLVLMAVSNFSFALLAVSGHSNIGMAGAIGFENIASGIGGVCVVAYFSALCDLRFTASQYALISAAASIVGRFLTGTTAGALIDSYRLCEFLSAHDRRRGAGHRAVLVHDARRPDRSVDRQRRYVRQRATSAPSTRRGNRRSRFSPGPDRWRRAPRRRGRASRRSARARRRTRGERFCDAVVRLVRAKAELGGDARRVRSGAKQAWSGIGTAWTSRDEPAERLEHARRVLGRKAGEDDVQRLAVGRSALGEAGDLARRGRDCGRRRATPRALPTSGPGARCCSRAGQSAQPIAALIAAVGTCSAVLVPQHRHGQRGVHRLMPARQARQRQVERALRIAIAKLAVPHDRVPACRRAAARCAPASARDLVDPARRSRADRAG